DESIPEAISASGAKILLVAMGQPRQEKWIYRHRERLGGILCVGVGGAFDVFSGNLQRAPVWVQRIGFEWLFRMLQEPGRWKNNLRLITFMMRIFASKLGLRGS
ncbi:MAG: WecB/TagA/CpsF family glycosyltransferase, partial [Synergistaceae bacterium]|nr:WecB/TagA/CpsF family glycosyltransferase [Synergistaceae bacterium]